MRVYVVDRMFDSLVIERMIAKTTLSLPFVHDDGASGFHIELDQRQKRAARSVFNKLKTNVSRIRVQSNIPWTERFVFPFLVPSQQSSTFVLSPALLIRLIHLNWSFSATFRLALYLHSLCAHFTINESQSAIVALE